LGRSEQNERRSLKEKPKRKVFFGKWEKLKIKKFDLKSYYGGFKPDPIWDSN